MSKKSVFFLLLGLSFSVVQAWQGALPSPYPIIKATSSSSFNINCRVVGISDGDTFTCLTADKQQIRVRMNGIDAPEKAQAYGNKAKQALSSLIFSKTVSVSVKSKDRYGRFIADVIADGRSVNKSMVLSGYAWVYREYVSASERSEYLKLEADAQTARRGLWADLNPIYPSQYRKGRPNNEKQF